MYVADMVVFEVHDITWFGFWGFWGKSRNAVKCDEGSTLVSSRREGGCAPRRRSDFLVPRREPVFAPRRRVFYSLRAADCVWRRVL